MYVGERNSLGKQAVLGANVVLDSSSEIIDVTGSEPSEMNGYVPERAEVILGSYTKKFPAGKYQVPCALIIGKRKRHSDLRSSLADTLKEYKISI